LPETVLGVSVPPLPSTIPERGERELVEPDGPEDPPLPKT
jgi:hypothetical protein